MPSEISISQLSRAITELSVGAPLDAGQVRSAAREALAGERVQGQLWGIALESAGNKVGLAVTTLRLAPSQLSVNGGLALPAVALGGSADAPLLVIIREVERFGKFRVHLVDAQGNDETRHVAAAELAALTGASDPTVVRQFCIAETMHPMESLKTPLGKKAGGATYRAMPAWRRFFRFLVNQRSDLGIAAVYGFAVSLLTIAPPIAAQVVINTVSFGALLQPLVVVVLILAAVLALSSLLKALQVVVVEVVSRRVFLRVASDFSNRLPRLDREGIGVKDPRELSNRFFDVVSVEKSLTVLLFDSLAAALQIITGTVLFGLYHPYLAFFSVGLIGSLCFVYFVLGQNALVTSLKESSAKYELAEWLERLAEHRTLFGSTSGLEFARNQTDQLARRWLKARQKHFGIVLRQYAGMLTIQVVASCLLLLVGGYLVISQQLTLGQLVAAELVMATTVGSVARIGKDLPKLYDLVTSVEKIGQVVDLPLERLDGEAMPQTSRRGLAVQARGLVYGPPHAARQFSLASLLVGPGDHVVLGARSGSARSQLLSLLVGQGQPTDGQLIIDGTDLRELNLPALREDITLMREVELVPGSIADNVRAGRERIANATIRRVLEEAGLGEAISLLPEGSRTKLDPQGAPLSRDQATLLMLARAAACAPRLVLVDGLLDGLADATLDRAVGVLCSKERGWTVIVSSSDPRVTDRMPRGVELEGAPPSVALPSIQPVIRGLDAE